MIESPDFQDPVLGIPVFSLYGQVRRPTAAMMDSFDVLLVDLQDLGCRIYTFITTLRMCSRRAQHRKAVWVLDRPNPAGRPVEGLRLREGWESFVGAGPLPMRHGLTLGELGHWFVRHAEARRRLPGHRDGRLASLIARPAYGWPLGERIWVNPSPNAANLWMVRAYAGTVMIEGTTLVGRSWHHATARIVRRARHRRRSSLRCTPWPRTGSRAAACAPAGSSRPFTSTWASSAGVQIHTRVPATTTSSSPGVSWRSLSRPSAQRPDYPLWRDFAYEYEHGRFAIDVINGSPLLREWVDDPSSTPSEFDAAAAVDEKAWLSERKDNLRYPTDSLAGQSTETDANSSIFPSIQVATTVSSSESATRSARAPPARVPRSASKPRNRAGVRDAAHSASSIGI